MHREEIIGIFIAVFFLVLTIVSYYWNFEIGKFAFTFLSGVFTTYVIQFRLRREAENREIKRQNYNLMRERIYGPISKNINLLQKYVREVKYFSDYKEKSSLEKALADHLFYEVEKGLGKELLVLLEKHEKYNRILTAKERVLHDIIIEETKKTLSIDIGSDARQVLIRLEVGKTFFTSLTLFRAVLLEISPKEFIKAEREKWGTNVLLEPKFYPKPEVFDINKFESIYNAVLDKVKSEPLFIEERKMRENLVMHIENYLKKIKPFVRISET